MGVMKSCLASSRKVSMTPKGERGGHGISVVMNEAELKRMIDTLPKRMHTHVLKKAVDAAAQIVKTAAAVNIAVVSAHTPNQTHIGNSVTTGTRKKRSNKQKLDRIGAQAANMADKITIKNLKHKKGRGAMAIVGADYYANNFGHTHEPLGTKKPAKLNLWGTGRTYQLPKRAWLGPAGKMTAALQKQAIKRVIKKRMKTV